MQIALPLLIINKQNIPEYATEQKNRNYLF